MLITVTHVLDVTSSMSLSNRNPRSLPKTQELRKASVLAATHGRASGMPSHDKATTDQMWMRQHDRIHHGRGCAGARLPGCDMHATCALGQRGCNAPQQQLLGNDGGAAMHAVR